MRKNQKAEIRKPEILENYYQVLIEEGLEGTSIGKIAKRMDIHPSLIIHYFKTKENSFSRVFPCPAVLNSFYQRHFLSELLFYCAEGQI